MAAGDETALASLYDQFAPFVYGLALRVTNDQGAAEDVVQDVFVGLWERPGGFVAARGPLRSYLGVIAHRRAVDWVRREAAFRRREERESARSPQPPPDVAEAATSMVLAQRVRDAVDALPPDQRQCVTLAYFAGHTYREVADLLGIPEGTAKSRLRLGMAKLAGMVDVLGMATWT
jgi:RNA polymerase sigma factor (sigma-70 family)